MLGKAMRFATVCTLAFAICGKANRGTANRDKSSSFSEGTTEDLEHRFGRETNFEDHLSATMNVSSILMRKPTSETSSSSSVRKLAAILALSSALTSADALASPGVQTFGVRPFQKDGNAAFAPIHTNNPLRGTPSGPLHASIDPFGGEVDLMKDFQDFQDVAFNTGADGGQGQFGAVSTNNWRRPGTSPIGQSSYSGADNGGEEPWFSEAVSTVSLDLKKAEDTLLAFTKEAAMFKIAQFVATKPFEFTTKEACYDELVGKLGYNVFLESSEKVLAKEWKKLHPEAKKEKKEPEAKATA